MFHSITLKLLVWREDRGKCILHGFAQNVKIVKFILSLNSVTEDKTALYMWDYVFNLDPCQELTKSFFLSKDHNKMFLFIHVIQRDHKKDKACHRDLYNSWHYKLFKKNIFQSILETSNVSLMWNLTTLKKCQGTNIRMDGAFLTY